ncbi:MAG TPA: RNA polymerase factor sigma-54 [Phycisphaerae bacterium]|nr:RNA polymerase factor sigma-54 [Phycisphaerae bacterium]
MRFDTGLHQRLEQRMILAPRMIQAMEILQLPLMELQERIEQELIANPVLELRPAGAEPVGESDEEAGGSPAAPTAEPERELVVRQNGDGEDFERLSNLVERWENYFEEAASWRRPRTGAADTKYEAIQNTADAGETLQTTMLNLWHLEDVKARCSQLGELIIRNLDDNGYLRVSLEDLAAEAQPPAAAEEMLEALRLVQAVGPLGVGARNVQECLLLQLQADPPYGEETETPDADEPLEVRIVRRHLDDLSANRFPQMAKALGASIDDVNRAVQGIRRLNPKPGAAISPQRTPHIIPDVQIEWDDELCQYRISTNDGDTPDLYISRAYRQLVKQRDLDPKTRQFVARNIRSARWLIDAVEQRRDTLRRVVEAIIKFQRPFFDDGPDHLRPMKMQEVADEVHLHVGTVSRAVADKYAETPWGIHALRDFFTGGTQTAEGQEVSWDHVRNRLKALIDAEDKSRPLSDEHLVERFKAEGIDVARRTVAKYREELDIPSSRRRRQF